MKKVMALKSIGFLLQRIAYSESANVAMPPLTLTP
jgi:hypothetical protein